MYRKKELLVSLLYSLLRYAVSTTQHFLLIHLFLPSVDYGSAMMLISVILMVQSIIPTMAMLDDLGVRGATSAYFFGFVVPESDASFVLRSEEHTSELQSLMRISYAVFCLNKKLYIS